MTAQNEARPLARSGVAQQSGTETHRSCDAEQIASWLKVLVAPDSTVELRVIFSKSAPCVRHYSSNDLMTLAGEALRRGRRAKGVYFLLNPLPVQWGGSPAKDADIMRRRLLLIDCDPKRKGTVSATDEEKAAARKTMVEVDSFLTKQGWPAPIIGDSGNGWHLLYWIDLTADDGGLVHRVLKVLASMFDNEAVSIDTTVGNASRFCKLYGTLAAKGANTTDRPHRVSKLITIPTRSDVVPTEMLQRLASEPEKPQPQPQPMSLMARSGDAGHASRNEAIEQARKYLAAMEASIEGQYGSNRLIKASSVLVNDFALTDGEAFDLLMVEFNPRCEPPWPVNEIRRKIDESRKNPPARPAKGPRKATIATRSSSSSRTNGQTQNIVAADTWPAPPAKEVFHGVTGGFVEIVSPHSEADPVALLIQFLVAVGNVLGRTAFAAAESARHHVNLFAVLVGRSSKGRKGSSWSHVRRLLEGIDATWTQHRVVSGLSSGEGLIWQCRDPIEQQQPIKQHGRVAGYELVTTDPGVTDKRLLVIEEEYASTLKVMSREANTLSPTIRQAWDSGLLRTMTKNNAAKATDAHISVVGHITRDELRRNLCESEQTNGFGNRFLWVCGERSKFLPDGGNLRDEDLEPIRVHVREAVSFAATAGKIDRDPETRKLWHEVYPRLSGDRFGLLGAMTARAEAQVLRLSVLYAVLDMSPVVKIEHLKAALAIWDYCQRSAEYVFGNSLGNRTADTLLAELRHVADVGLTRTAMIQQVFKKNKSATDIADALRLLHDNGLAHRKDDLDPETGRGAERWFATLKT